MGTRSRTPCLSSRGPSSRAHRADKFSLWLIKRGSPNQLNARLSEDWSRNLRQGRRPTRFLPIQPSMGEDRIQKLSKSAAAATALGWKADVRYSSRSDLLSPTQKRSSLSHQRRLSGPSHGSTVSGRLPLPPDRFCKSSRRPTLAASLT